MLILRNERSVRFLGMVATVLGLACLTASTATAAVTCTTTSKGQTCTVESGDNVWVTVSWKQHPPADSISCSTSASASGASHVNVQNLSGAVIYLNTDDGDVLQINDGEEVNHVRGGQLVLDADDIPDVSAGSNSYVKVTEHHNTGDGVGREHVLQFGSSAEGLDDGMTYQMYAVDMASGERVQDVLTDTRGEQYLDLLTAEGVVIVSFEGEFDGPADLDFSGTVDVNDLDVLTSAVSSDVQSEAYDVNGDGQVDANDVTEWLSIAGAKLNASGEPFLPGDANLDGAVDVSDYNVWNRNKFTQSPQWAPMDVGGGWSTGDFNADGLIDVGDFGIWNANKFNSARPIGSSTPKGKEKR